jgi:hypothetical protein
MKSVSAVQFSLMISIPGTCKIDLGKSFSKLNPLIGLVAKSTGNEAQEITGLMIGSENYAGSTFVIERRTNIAFSEHRYYSKALLPTTKHLQILNQLAKLRP